MEHVKVDLSPAEMYVLTPNGKILTLPLGATALDFAYAVHTDLGDHANARSLTSRSPYFHASDHRRPSKNHD